MWKDHVLHSIYKSGRETVPYTRNREPKSIWYKM